MFSFACIFRRDYGQHVFLSSVSREEFKEDAYTFSGQAQTYKQASPELSDDEPSSPDSPTRLLMLGGGGGRTKNNKGTTKDNGQMTSVRGGGRDWLAGGGKLLRIFRFFLVYDSSGVYLLIKVIQLFSEQLSVAYIIRSTVGSQLSEHIRTKGCLDN